MSKKEEAEKLFNDLPLTRKQGDIIISLLCELLRNLNAEESIKEMMKSSGVRPIKIVKSQPEEAAITKQQIPSRYCNISDFIVCKEDGSIDTSLSNCIAIVAEAIINKCELEKTFCVNISPEDNIKNLGGHAYDMEVIQKALEILHQKQYITFIDKGHSHEVVMWIAKNKNPLERSTNNGNITNNLKNLNYIDISAIKKIPVVYRELVGRLLDTTRTKSSSIPQFYTTEHGKYDKDSILEAISKSPISDIVKLMFESYWLKEESNTVFIYDKNTNKYSLNTNMLYNIKSLKEI